MNAQNNASTSMPPKKAAQAQMQPLGTKMKRKSEKRT